MSKEGTRRGLTYKSGSEVIEISAGSSGRRNNTTFSIDCCCWRRGGWFTEEAHYHIHHEHSERESFQHLPCCLLGSSLALSCCCWGSIPSCRGLQQRNPDHMMICVFISKSTDCLLLHHGVSDNVGLSELRTLCLSHN